MVKRNWTYLMRHGVPFTGIPRSMKPEYKTCEMYSYIVVKAAVWWIHSPHNPTVHGRFNLREGLKNSSLARRSERSAAAFGLAGKCAEKEKPIAGNGTLGNNLSDFIHGGFWYKGSGWCTTDIELLVLLSKHPSITSCYLTDQVMHYCYQLSSPLLLTSHPLRDFLLQMVVKCFRSMCDTSFHRLLVHCLTFFKLDLSCTSKNFCSDLRVFSL